MPYKDLDKRRRAARESNKKHREARSKAEKLWRERNPDRTAEHQRNYHASHVLQRRASSQDWKTRHKERSRETARAWAQRNPHAVCALSALRRARKARANGTHTAAERRARFAEYAGKCAYCLIADATDLDHMTPLSRGGSNDIGNLVPACKRCNIRKGVKTLLECLRPYNTLALPFFGGRNKVKP